MKTILINFGSFWKAEQQTEWPKALFSRHSGEIEWSFSRPNAYTVKIFTILLMITFKRPSHTIRARMQCGLAEKKKRKAKCLEMDNLIK